MRLVEAEEGAEFAARKTRIVTTSKSVGKRQTKLTELSEKKQKRLLDIRNFKRKQAARTT